MVYYFELAIEHLGQRFWPEVLPIDTIIVLNYEQYLFANYIIETQLVLYQKMAVIFQNAVFFCKGAENFVRYEITGI